MAAQSRPDSLFRGYDLGGYFDEMFTAPGEPRPHYRKLFSEFAGMAMAQFEERQQLADFSFLLHAMPRTEWDHIERGLTQRVPAWRK
jgi:uncharacterized circularly permuted ATP-grasp superfamily protein